MTGAPSYAETPHEEQLIDAGDAAEVDPLAVRGLEGKAGEDMPDGRRLQCQGRFPHSRQVPTSVLPVRNSPSRPNISTSFARSLSPRSPQPHTPIHLPLAPGEVAPVSSLATYSLGSVSTMRRETLDGPTSAPAALTCRPASPPQSPLTL